MLPNLHDCKIAVIGLGYVGFPLAVAFARLVPVVAFDLNSARIEALLLGNDSTGEVDTKDFDELEHLFLTTNVEHIRDCNVYIVCVPTPIDEFKKPDLTPLMTASRMVGQHLDQGNVVLFESTVYPGVTEECCVPIIESVSGLKFNEGFYVGYSPERVNPGDKGRTLETIVKVTSGSTDEAADFIDALYKQIVTAGTHRAQSIRIAEAAKVIENIQRDVNIALMNELSILFEKLGIPTADVLAAARTKWNFLDFRPGLVGGHCIGVDPYYLTHKAQQIGYHPEIILSGRRINDSMPEHIATNVIRYLMNYRVNLENARMLVLGLTFKEDCPDTRNTKVVDLVYHIKRFDVTVDVFDPYISSTSDENRFDFNVIEDIRPGYYDGAVIAVSHKEFREMGIDKISSFLKDNAPIFDLKGVFPPNKSIYQL